MKMAIMVEIKPEGELEIERQKENQKGGSTGFDFARYGIHTAGGGKRVTKYNYTCPYCFQPFNYPDKAKECRDECYKRLQAHPERRNVRFCYHGYRTVYGRVVSMPDEVTVLTGVCKDKGLMEGPAQLLWESIEKDILPE